MSQTELAQVLEALPLPILLIGADERILRLNTAASQLMPAAAAGRHYITAIRQPGVLDLVEAALRQGTRGQSRYLGSGAGRDSTWTVTAVPLGGGQAGAPPGGRGVVLSFEDVSAQEAASSMRRDFVANVSHELRTPLTALLGFVETLKGPARNDPSASARFLDLAAAEASRMARLVADLLSLARVEDDERVRPRTPVPLKPLIGDVAETLMPIADRDGTTLTLDLPVGEVVVPGDAVQLRQVLSNLVENAIKYGGRGGTVTVSLSPPQPESALRVQGVRIAVSDAGEGIAPHHIPRLTERFYRVDSHRSREVGGTGLGLAIVKHIVSRHRGRLRIESTPGAGSRFTVVLPME